MSFGRLERTAAPRPIGDINMTPLIDVMLVLLVIFMVTAPLMVSSLKLDLPASESAVPDATPHPVLEVSIDREGVLRLGEETIGPADLAGRFAAAARREPRTEVHLRVDRGIPYGRVAELIGAAQSSGLTRIGFVAEPAPAAAAR